MKSALLVLVCVVVACGPSSRSSVGDGGGATIELAPATATLTVIAGVAQTQAYTATLVEPDGTRTDVTNTATFSVTNPGIGSWSGPTLTANGAAAGVTQVIASLASGATGNALVTVVVDNSRVEGGVPADSGTMFAGATVTSSLAPTIVYPSEGILAPPNLGAFDVHWTSSANLFAVDFSNAYVDFTIYTNGLPGGSFWTMLTPAEWAALAGSQQELTLTVSAMNQAAPSMKGVSAPLHIDVTNEPMVGGVYYWTTSSPQGIFRYDMTKPEVPPAPYFMAADNPGGASNCMGCHALSHDGTKFALTIDHAEGRGTIINVADGTVLVPYATNAQYWDLATFNADGSKLVTAQTGTDTGTLALRDTAGGGVITTIPNTPGTYGTHPELSPDGTMLADVEETQLEDDYEPDTGAVVVRTFDDASNTFGPITSVIADGVDGLSSYYPSWSPDNQWLLVTRVEGSAYGNVDSTVWVVKADGTAPPIKLANADLTGSLEDSWARWAPFAQTTGADGESVFFLTFSSQRPFGVRIPEVGTPQIWMTPFYPNKAAAGLDPSGPAFHVPFQDITTHNHIAQWTQQVITIARKAP